MTATAKGERYHELPYYFNPRGRNRSGTGGGRPEVLDATGVPIEWENTMPVEVMEGGNAATRGGPGSIRRNKVALKGPITTPIGTTSAV